MNGRLHSSSTYNDGVLKLKFFFGINPASLRSSANIEAIGEEEGQDVIGLIGMVHFRADAAGLQ